MSDEKRCGCDRKAVLTINVTKADGELIEQVHLCEECGLHPRSIQAFENLGIRIDESLIR
jgi:hypothetical protein